MSVINIPRGVKTAEEYLHRTPWYDQQSSICSQFATGKARGLELKYVDHLTDLSHLSKLCCMKIAEYILTTTVEEAAFLVETMPNAISIECLYMILSCAGFMSFNLRWTFMQSSKLSEASELKNTIITPYRSRISINDIFHTIKYLNNLTQVTSRQCYIALYITDIGSIEKLPFLFNLSLLVFSSESTTRTENVLRLWLSNIRMNSNNWNTLQFIALPQITSPKLIYDCLQLIPSLNYIEAAITPDEVSNIPVLKNCLRYEPDIFKKVSSPKLGNMVKSILDHKSDNFDYIFDLSIHSEQPKRSEKSNLTFIYTRKPDILQKVPPKEVRKRTPRIKKPRIRNISVKMSTKSFFGFQ